MIAYDTIMSRSIFTDDATYAADKPDQPAAAEIVKTPKEVLPCKQTPSAVVQSTEVQKESADTTDSSRQEMSVAGVVERVTLPPNLTETQG